MSNSIFKNKKILVAGGTGMVGQQIIPKLIKDGGKVYVVSMDNKNLVPKKVKKFLKLNMISIKNCLKATKGMDIVFNLLGVTGSPVINNTKPGSFMMSNLYCAINLLYAAEKNKVKRYLYTSTYGVYGKSSVMKENTVWKTFPSEHDKYAGWAKRIGELQIEAYRKEFNFKSLHIVRPANIYGPYVNFNPKNSMVVASLIRRIIGGENPLRVWGDGSNVRDFIHSEDVAEALIMVMKKNIQIPINIGSGKGLSIKDLIFNILKCKNIKIKPKLVFDKSKASGDKKRILDTKLAQKNGIKPKKNIKDGLEETIEWYLKNLTNEKNRFNYFNIND